MPKLEELLVEELRDLLDAEKQLTKALPKLARVAQTQELKQAFLDHTEMTKNQVQRLEQAFELLGQRAKSKPCKAMKGLVEEANEHVSEHGKGTELDAMLVAAAQRVEHYEIAGYGTARAYAKSMKNRDVASLLEQTLKEEATTDKLLSKVGLQIQKDMLSEEGEDTGEADQQMRRYAGEAAGARGARSGGGNKGNGGRGGSGAGGGTKKKVAAASGSGGRAEKRGGASSGRGGSRGATRNGGSSAGSQVTSDHDQIRQWAEERGAHPACVRGTGSKGDIGMIRLDFPGYSGGESLAEITWDEFFEKFDEQGLALLYQDKTARGQKSNFNKLVSRQTAEQGGKGGRGSSRKSARR